MAPKIWNRNIFPKRSNTGRWIAICGCSMNRRQFFLSWISQNMLTSIEVEVIEIFSASDGPAALLIHHASEAARKAFGEWLRAHDGARIICRFGNGTSIDGRIFRV